MVVCVWVWGLGGGVMASEEVVVVGEREAVRDRGRERGRKGRR